VLDGLFVTPAVTAIEEALASLEDVRRIAVVGHAKLASNLARDPEQRRILPVGMSGRAAAKLAKVAGVEPPLEREQLSTIDAGTLDAVVGVDIVDDAAWQDTLRAWTRVVRDGGAVVLVDRGSPSEASRRALCSGLTEIEQRHVGRVVVTSGLITHLA
jgi:hypothetical protein